MNRIILTVVSAVALLTFSSGCFNTGMGSRVPSGALRVNEKTIYFTEVQSFPTPVLLKSIEQPVVVAPTPAATPRAIDPALVAAVAAEIFKIVPETMNSYKNIKSSVGTVNREFLATGYGTNELEGIKAIVNELQNMSSKSILRDSSK